jgi:hypothetical protein
MKELRELDLAAAVVDLTRMPSQGKYWAAIPDAQFVSVDELPAALKRARPVAEPVQPERMMASTRSTAQKMGTASGITQFVVQDAAIQVGVVDYKICAVDDTWTGMAFAVKK